MNTLTKRLQKEVAKEVARENIADLDKIVAHTIAETLKAVMEVRPEEKDYMYDSENEEHNEFEKSLEDLDTSGEAHEEGYNTALQAWSEAIKNIK